MMNAESWFHCASVNGPGEWGLGMLLVLVEGIHPLAKLNSRFLTLTDREDEDLLRENSIFFLPFYLVLGKFVDVHVNAWIREV